jgi:gamma-glutamylaminecyclotransferase
MNQSDELLFVYGTLRRGGSNHFRMAGARFMAAGTVRGRIYQIDWFPGLILDAAAGGVRGEVFAADARLIAQLDAFEGTDYRRVRAVVTTDDGESIDAWLWEWLGAVDETRRIVSGDWLDAEPAPSSSD